MFSVNSKYSLNFAGLSGLIKVNNHTHEKLKTLFLITKRIGELVMITAELLTELTSKLSGVKAAAGKDTDHPLGNGGNVTLYPATEEEISSILAYANKYKLTVSIMGAGTKRGYGGQREACDLMLSLENYRGIVEHTVGDMTITVKSGTTIRELQDHLARSNQRISIDPFWPEDATIGGVIAANDSGPKRLRYGSARDAVIGLRTVYPDGTVIRSGGKVVKNVAGYDMNKLFIGSMGTLGVISEVTMKLRPLAKYESLVLVPFSENQLNEIRPYSVKVLDSYAEPVCIELLNPTLAEKLTGVHQFTLAIAFEDVETSVQYQEDILKQLLPANTQSVILAKEEAHEFWNQFYRICPNGKTAGAENEALAAIKIGVVNLDIIRLLQDINSLQDLNNVQIYGHGGLGHGLGQIIIRGAKEDVTSVIHHIRSSAQQLNGYAVIKHLPQELRKEINVWGQNPAYFRLFEGIKTKIDPNRILNPNRFVGGI